jgi:hypothetical protein
MALPFLPLAAAGILLAAILMRSQDTRIRPVAKIPLGRFVLTWYSFQDNTPVNSARSSSGRPLVPYISVAVPFRLLSAFGGELHYGDKLYVEFLHDRIMANGKRHTGWVQIDDFCGDEGNDAYCFQEVDGKKYPNVDLYVGDFTQSGIDPKTCLGPAGGGAELTSVFVAARQTTQIVSHDYGGSAIGSGKCGDLAAAKLQQGNCWTYTPPAESSEQCPK